MPRLFVISLFAAYLSLSMPSEAEGHLIQDVSVIPMTSEETLPHRDVLIRDGRIATIEPSGGLDAGDAQVIDGTGKFLIPGLFDIHVHLNGRMDYQDDMLFLYAANGVTTVMSMAGSNQVLKLAGMTESGEMFGPRIFTTSPIMGNISPYPPTEEKARELVEKYANLGYRYLKVYNQIPEAGYWGIIEAAKEHDMTVVGHAVRSVGIEGAIKAGQHVVHMEEFVYGYFDMGHEANEIPALARQLKEAGIVVIPNLIAYHNIIRQVEDLDAMIASDGVDLLPWGLRKDFGADKNSYTNRFDMEDVANSLGPNLELMQKVTKAFEDAGVPLLSGTDAVMNIVVPGFSIHDELRELVEAGLTPYQALKCATIRPAEFLKIDAETGSVEPGKAADLVLLDANPLEDIGHTRAIAGVSVRGRWLPDEEIREEYSEIRKRARESEPVS